MPQLSGIWRGAGMNFRESWRGERSKWKSLRGQEQKREKKWVYRKSFKLVSSNGFFKFDF